MHEPLARAMAELPLVAILRGLRPERGARRSATALIDAGFRILEVPLNSPEPFASIRLLADAFGADGAGRRRDGDRARRRGRACTTPAAGWSSRPHTDPRGDRGRQGRRHGLPARASPRRARRSPRCGPVPTRLKLFPAETLGPATLKAWRAVLPAEVALLPVGGITPTTWPRGGRPAPPGSGSARRSTAPATPRPRSPTRPRASSEHGATGSTRRRAPLEGHRAAAIVQPCSPSA